MDIDYFNRAFFINYWNRRDLGTYHTGSAIPYRLLSDLVSPRSEWM